MTDERSDDVKVGTTPDEVGELHENRVRELGRRLGRELGPIYEGVLLAGGDPRVQADEGEVDAWDALGDEAAQAAFEAGFADGLVERQEREIETFETTESPAESVSEAGFGEVPGGDGVAGSAGVHDPGEGEDSTVPAEGPPSPSPESADEGPAEAVLRAAIEDGDADAADLLRTAYEAVLRADNDGEEVEAPSLEDLAVVVTDAADGDEFAQAQLSAVLATLEEGLRHAAEAAAEDATD